MWPNGADISPRTLSPNRGRLSRPEAATTATPWLRTLDDGRSAALRHPIRLRSDLNAEDDNGENWALLANARDSSEVRVGGLMVAGTPGFWSVVRITAVDPDGQVHFVQLDGNDPPAQELLATVA